jgi:hypothetical protein
MSSDRDAKITLHYYIELPPEAALEVRDDLEPVIWEIARAHGVDEVLRDAQLSVEAGEPAIDLGIPIAVAVTFLALKTTNAGIGKAKQVWAQVILPDLRRRFGPRVLTPQDGEDDI